MKDKRVEIVCAACGEETLIRREAVYEGFKKTGEKLSCSGCGHVYPDEAAVPFKQKRAPSLFSDDDRSRTVDIFAATEKGHNCRHCVHYVVNPFTQRCGLHNRVVEATDVCGSFERNPKVKDEE